MEVYNPWSPNKQWSTNDKWSPDALPPLELYSKIDSSLPVTNNNRWTRSLGVELGRVTDLAWDSDKDASVPEKETDQGKLTSDITAADKYVTRSPVWRLIVVEEWPIARDVEYANKVDSEGSLNNYLKNPTSAEPPNHINLAVPKAPNAYRNVSQRFQKWLRDWKTGTKVEPPHIRPSDPDFDPQFDGGFVPTEKPGGMGTTDHYTFNLKYPYIEREFYFTTDKSPLAVSVNDPTERDLSKTFNLRIPNRRIDAELKPGKPNPIWPQKFIPNSLELGPIAIGGVAPLLPGRYGVIGSAGTWYDFDQEQHRLRYTATIGRKVVTDDDNTDDDQHNTQLKGAAPTRRIILWPSLDPDKQQVLVSNNGGNPKGEIFSAGSYDPYSKEISRDNELIYEKDAANSVDIIKNIQDSQDKNVDTLTGEPNNRFYQPSIAIPVEGMNISEPPWGWTPREVEVAKEEKDRQQKWKDDTKPPRPGTPTAPNLAFDPTAAHGEGRYASNSVAGDKEVHVFDVPFDTTPETMRTGTTANYRMIHLQRLANPLLPWNPPPGQYFDTNVKPPRDLYRPNLPVNPYRTIDSASVNLTAFNGVSAAEGKIDTNKRTREGKVRPWAGGERNEASLYPDAMFNTKFEDPTAKNSHQVWYFRSQDADSGRASISLDRT